MRVKRQKPKLTLNEVEDKILELQEYSAAVGASKENTNMLLRLQRNFRIHNTSLTRRQRSFKSFYKVIEKEENNVIDKGTKIISIDD